MSAIETKPKIYTPPPPPPSTTTTGSPPSAKKSLIDHDYSTTSGPSGLGALFASPKPAPLTGPGVASEVVGKVSPDLSKWTPAQLVQGIAKMSMAMKAHPGKVNDEDFALLRGMINQLALKAGAPLPTSTSPEKMGNVELFQTLLQFDLAKTSGQKMTKEELAYHEKLESTFKERAKVDPDKMLKDLEHQREELLGKSFLHCGAAAAGAASVGLHAHVLGTAAGLGMMLHALHDKEYGHAFTEALVLVASHTPAGAIAEGASVVANVAACADAAQEVDRLNTAIQYYEKLSQKKAASP